MSTGSETSSRDGAVAETPATLEAEDRERKSHARSFILLVEDSPTTMALLSRPLSQHYALLAAEDGVAAWDLLQTHPEIELVITDIMMPRMSGHELLVKIRQSDTPQIRKLPVIVIAGIVDKDHRDLAFSNGANDFVTKPIDATELQARVHVHHKLARTIHELETSRQALAQQATTDPLTRLKNRRALLQAGKQALALGQRSKSDVSVMLVDIDHFKQVNDTYGHPAGDKVLIAIGNLLTHMGRSVDTVARVGGEEFAIILPDTSRDGAAVLAERIRAAVERAPFHASGQSVSLTISIGVATLGTDPAENVDALFEAADRRLYVAKKKGRNRICSSDQSDESSYPC